MLRYGWPTCGHEMCGSRNEGTRLKEVLFPVTSEETNWSLKTAPRVSHCISMGNTPDRPLLLFDPSTHSKPYVPPLLPPLAWVSDAHELGRCR